MITNASFPVINLQQTGANIERRRRDAGMSVRDLQTYFGFEYPQAIYKWQHGECLPTVDNLLALSRILHVRMEDLLAYEDQEVIFWGKLGMILFCCGGRFCFATEEDSVLSRKKILFCHGRRFCFIAENGSECLTRAVFLIPLFFNLVFHLSETGSCF